MNDEIILEKYTNKPITIKINEDNMLDCGGVIVADNVLLFDAITDISGAVHGVLLNAQGQILYFRLAGGLPVSKSIASGVAQKSLKHLSITEQDGILHILIVKCEKNFTVHHYRTQGNSWIRSFPKNMDAATMYVDSCPCGQGKFALLVKCDENYILYLETFGKWQQIQHSPLPEDYTDISMTYFNGNIELVTSHEDGKVISSVLASPSIQKAENQAFEIKEIRKNPEDNMANGSIINSRYVTQLQENTDEIALIKEELSKLRSDIDNMSKILENAEKQYKYITICRDAAKQHDTQINQLGIKLQELINRFNGFSKQAR